MPSNVKMTGYNRSSTDPLRLVLFKVSDPTHAYLIRALACAKDEDISHGEMEGLVSDRAGHSG